MPQSLEVGALARTISALLASSSHALLNALERGNIAEVRSALMNIEGRLIRASLLTPSYECRHELRTPLMCALRTGNFAIFKTIMHAFNTLFTNPTDRASEMTKQLLQHDRDGLTVAMHAARAGHLVALKAILKEIHDSGATAALTAKDHQQMTLLMHSAAAGHSAGFQEVVRAIDKVLEDDEMAEHMMLRSSDGHTLLMIAAASSDKMTFKSCSEAIRLAVTPHNFRMLMKVRDTDGMTFLMHAANPCPISVPCGGRNNEKHIEPISQADDDGPVNCGGGSGGGGGGSTRAGAGAGSRCSSPPPRGLAWSLSMSASASAAPAARGPGGSSEEVLRRLSLQKALIGPTEGALKGGDLDESDVGDDNVDESKHSHDDDDDDVRLSHHDTRTATVAGSRQKNDEETDGSVSVGVPTSSKGRQQRLSQHQSQQQAQQQQQQQQQKKQQKQQQLDIPKGGGMDPRVPVLKAAVALNKNHLWKEQVREMLTARDSWGRTLVSHGILSASPQVFEVSMTALRADVLDEEVEALVEDVENYDREKPLVLAEKVGGKSMSASVHAKLGLLKRDVDIRAKASTFDAKLQSFIPGKLIVIFQLLLPEVPSEKLTLLVVMSAIAPMLAWASVLIARNKSAGEVFVPRSSFYSQTLAAPAMFVWGVGTSRIFEDSYGWSQNRAAVVLAVGAIIIPAVDGFVNSRRVEQWNDKFFFSRWRFKRKAERRWKKLKKSNTTLGVRDPCLKDAEPVTESPGLAEKLPATKPVPPSVQAPIAEDARAKQHSWEEAKFGEEV
ncbi:unnamed protein product [Pylaiella littoralis]